MTRARDIFRSWTAFLAEQLVDIGMDGAEAHDLAGTSLATMEGALILCRVEGNVDPLEVAAKQLRSLVTRERP